MPFVGCCALVYFWTLRFSRIGDFYTLRLGFFGNLDLRIIYGDDFDTARKAILELLAADKRVFDDPAPFVVLSSLADSAIEITVRVWTASENYWGVFFDFNEQVYKQFDKYGLHFPYPQVDVHMIQDNQ